MFTQLLASRPPRQQSAPEFLGSVTLHGFIVAAAWAAFAPLPRGISDPVHQRVIYVPPSAPAPTVQPPAPATPVAPTSRLPDLSRLTIADPIAPSLPSLPAAMLAGFPRGTSLSPGGLGVPVVVDREPGSTYLAEQVEVTAALEKGSPIPRYPAALRFIAVDGTARFQFVVDTLGRVELPTVRELQSTREEFGLAVRATLPRMRFTPARVGGHAVRQLVEFPVVFRISR